MGRRGSRGLRCRRTTARSPQGAKEIETNRDNQTFESALAWLGKRDTRKVANNTYLQRRSEGRLAVKLHNTDILTFHPDGSVVFTTGGWKTMTTKERMNRFGTARGAAASAAVRRERGVAGASRRALGPERR